MNAQASSSGQTTINVSQLSRLLDLTPRRVQQLVQQGVIPKAGRDAYPLVGAVQGYLRWLTDDDRRVAGSASAQRVANARADEIEARITEKMKDLVPIEDQRMTVATLLEIVKRELADLPGRLPLHIRSAIRADISASIARIEKTAAQAIKVVQSGRDPEF
ncbi:MAG: hypothetical protein E5X34_29780 [Mesorhizobium sp.]|uniref:hypothetical protein n=1 Tax=Mesorhizobium sp. TaxID=1871066 RepID=UPI0011F8C3DD|nr:hypothetical protein [Mesorhizobium sp.]TIR15286.1 MAG: hypothetical protein E5X34_29780 [Mesorhizobium sp.]